VERKILPLPQLTYLPDSPQSSCPTVMAVEQIVEEKSVKLFANMFLNIVQ
jgi:hypothetical protein